MYNIIIIIMKIIFDCPYRKDVISLPSENHSPKIIKTVDGLFIERVIIFFPLDENQPVLFKDDGDQ